MKSSHTLLAGIFILAMTIFAPSVAMAQELTAKTVVLVHGGFADGSSWSRVIPILKKVGLEVIAVQNPLESLEGDVAVASRAIERAKGPVVLVGHSWGGMVITEAGVNDKVQSLVYVAAFAPSKGQSLVDTTAGYPKAAGLDGLSVDSNGYATLTPNAFAKYFTPDLPTNESAVLAATQSPVSLATLKQITSNVAWKTKPSWYAVSENDQMIPPELQREFVKKLNATSISLAAGHASMLSQPVAIAALIIAAAE